VSCEDYERYAAGLASRLEAEREALDEDTLAERLETVALQQELARAYRASEELLREKKRVSFGSLITGAVGLLERDAQLREALQRKYRYILVDEFQDTNIAQLRLLELLASPTRNIVAVGDNDQAIYRFRGASFGSFKLFLERFAGWKEGRDSTPFRVALTENYRSTPNILRVAMQVIGAKRRERGLSEESSFSEQAGQVKRSASPNWRHPKKNHNGWQTNFSEFTERGDAGKILQCSTASMRTGIIWWKNSRGERYLS